MAAKVPDGFFAATLLAAYPDTHTYKIALYEHAPDFSTYTDAGRCPVEPYTLQGYQVIDHGPYATLKFNKTVDWFNVTVKTRGAAVYDDDTKAVLSVMDFEKDCGVFNGVFTLNLNDDGVVVLGNKPE